MPLCPSCLTSYPQERQELGYSTCAQCASRSTYKAGLHYQHKTAGSLDIMSSEQWPKYQRVTSRIGKHSSNMSRTARQSTSYTI